MADFGNPPREKINIKLLRRAALAFSSLMLVLSILASWPLITLRQPNKHVRSEVQAAENPLAVQPDFPVVSATATPTLSFIFESSLENAASPAPAFPFEPLEDHLAIIAMAENSYTHLFAYQPGSFPFFRLTSGEWDDIDPAISPDGKKVAFASNRDLYWELYVMDLESGQTNRITYSPEYDGSPSWSPDGLWLVYESYTPGSTGSDFEIFIRPIDGQQEPIRLTNDPSADHSPAWSPEGRKIAYVSDRSGTDDIWLADLDKVEERLENLSRNQHSAETHPSWSPDGNRLLWTSSTEDGLQNIMTWDLTQPQERPRSVNTGSWAVWSPDAQGILAAISTPNRTYLCGYNIGFPSLTLPILSLTGPVSGLSWGKKGFSGDFPAIFTPASMQTPTAAWDGSLVPGIGQLAERAALVPLEKVEPAGAMLQERVAGSFISLRDRVSREVGWDFLASLDQTYMPLTAILGPGMNEDWAFTGRSFRFNPAPVKAGWVMVVREDFGPQTYWRIYLRARFQDGTQGIPLKTPPWDLFARLSGDAKAYEQGGIETPVPLGYWVDFTKLALGYGWERMPAQSTWRLAFSAARFDQFINTEGLDWLSAMQQVYPREALNTATPIPTSTIKPSATLTFTPTLTPSRTPWLSRTPTPTHTLTPAHSPNSIKNPAAPAKNMPTNTPTPY